MASEVWAVCSISRFSLLVEQWLKRWGYRLDSWTTAEDIGYNLYHMEFPEVQYAGFLWSAYHTPNAPHTLQVISVSSIMISHSHDTGTHTLIT